MSALEHDLLDARLRRVVPLGDAEFRPYDRTGRVQPGLHWVDLGGVRPDGSHTFLLRFDPGTRSRAHEHTGGEEFLVLEGELHDSDGRVLRRGDYVIYAPGSRHASVAPGGCLLLVVLRGANRPLATD